METSFAGANCYWRYLEITGTSLDAEALSHITRNLEDTSWDDPISALELNNFAVVALIEAEQCEDLSLRGMYLEVALEALNRGVELQNHPLCLAHLSLILAMTGEAGQAVENAFSGFINTLHPAYLNEQIILPGLVYLPPRNGLIEIPNEQLSQILQARDGYSQAMLLFSEVLCQSQLVFYNTTGLRFIYLAGQLFSNTAFINLKLGIAQLINRQWEGLLYLHRAREIAPNCINIIQALYLAYRDLGDINLANAWLEMGKNVNLKDSQSLAKKWTELEIDSPITYISFEKELVLAVEPTFRSIVTSVLIAEGDWFEKEMEFWRSWIQPGMTVIDVGANAGVYTFSAARRVGKKGCVIAIEPFSGCVRCLQETCRINHIDWVTVCAGAASDRNGIVRLALHTASELNNVVDSDISTTLQPGTFEDIPCFRLDSLIEDQQLSQVDILKIDAEGHEINILHGSERILTEFAPCILYENIAGSQEPNLAVADFLKANGYQLFRYQPYVQNLIPINSHDDLPGLLNVIAMKKINN